MFRKLAVALLAATVFTAPVLAQGTPATPPAKASTTTSTAAPAPKIVAAKPTLKVAKIKKGKRFSGRHFAHVKHFKHAKHVKAAKSVRGAKYHVRHVVRGNPTVVRGAMSATKPRTGTN